MKNILLISLTLILISGKLFSQEKDKKINNLMFLLVDEKYEAVVNKGEVLMQNDTYKRHPLVYLYTAKGYYEMSRLPGKFDVGEKESKFPKPLKNAEKYLYKYIKAEAKVKKYFPDYDGSIADNKDFLEAIADTANKLGQLLYIMEKPRKAASEYKNAFKGVPMDPILQLWQGIAEVKSKNAVEGDRNILAALKKIDENFEPSKATRGVLAHGMQIIEEHLRGKGDYTNADKAKKLVDVFKKYDPDELDKAKMEARNKKTKEAISNDEVLRKFYSNENESNSSGKVIIKDGDHSHGNKSDDAEKELDKMEKEEKGGGK